MDGRCPCRHERDALDAVAKVGTLQMRLQHRPDVPLVATGPAKRQRDANGRRTVCEGEGDIEASKSHLARTQQRHEFRDQHARAAMNRFPVRRGAVKHVVGLQHLPRPHRHDHFGSPAEGRIDAFQRVGSEAGRQRRARQLHQRPDAIKSKRPQGRGLFVREIERFDRHRSHAGGFVAGLDRHARDIAMSRRRSCTADGRCDGQPRAKAESIHRTPDQGQKPMFALVQPLRAGDVHHEAIRRVDADDRGEAMTPCRHGPQCIGIAFGLPRHHDHPLPNKRTSLCQTHAAPDAASHGSRAGRRHDLSALMRPDHQDRTASRRPRFGPTRRRFTPHSFGRRSTPHPMKQHVDRPHGEPDRNHATHRWSDCRTRRREAFGCRLACQGGRRVACR